VLTGTTTIRARWLLPIDRPIIDGGWIDVSDDRIAEVGRGRPTGAAQDLGDVAILPGLVNAHTHLELSWLAGRVPPAGSMVDWIRTLLHQRAASKADETARASAMDAAAAEMHAAGTVLVGDISNTLTSAPALSRAGLGGVIFHELLGFNPSDPRALVRDAWARIDRLKAAPPGTPALRQAQGAPSLSRGGTLQYSVVAHAPYSTSPALFSEIVRHARSAPLSVHLAESPQEVEFLRTGRGPFRDLLEHLGVWAPAWSAPQADPVEYMRRLGYLRPGLLAVHAVQLTDDALARLAAAGAIVVTCPRSNEWVGAGLPRVSHFYSARVPVAIGTDSLASVPTLNLFDELEELRRIAPDVTAASLLDSATRQGARALGREAEFGTIRPGKRARLIAVTIPPGVTDVEEYLVSGVPVSSVRHVQ
jgi:aminodeoxyfutalosine deaminase